MNAEAQLADPALPGPATDGAAPPAAPRFRAAIALLAAGRTVAAIPLLRLCVETGEEAEFATLNLGMALMDIGRAADAEPVLQAAARMLPDEPEPRFRLGQVAAQRGALHVAREHFDAALARDPLHVMSLVALSALEEAAGRTDHAVQLLDTALLLAPQDGGIARLRMRLAGASVAQALAQLDDGGLDAARLAARVVPIERLRDGPAWPWHAAEGLALLAAGEEDEGLAALRLATLLADDAPDMLAELGRQLHDLRQFGEAAPILERAVAARPWDVALRVLHGASLFKLHRLADARAVLEQALADLGPHAGLSSNLALVLNGLGEQEAALAASIAAGSSPMVLASRMGIQPYHHTQGSGQQLLDTARRLGAQLPPAQPFRHPPGFAPARRLRVGFLSTAFGRHPVGWLTLAGIEALPRDEFEVACFSLRGHDDALARRFRATADLWRDLPRLDDAALVAALRADAPDILVDLGGHGEGGRAAALSRRAAPVQIKWVGAQSATTGVPAMDWMLTDRWETPPGAERLYTERLLPLSDGYVCYTPPPVAPDVGPLPALARGHVTFGCFNNLSKITPDVLATWARLLDAVPGSRLVLRTHAFGDAAVRDLVQARASALGIPPGRLALHGPVSHEALLGAYNDIDIALDPFPYAGGLTAIEALYMGVPLVAMAGTSFAGRHAVSHLSNVGLADWVATDPAGYVARAVSATQDLAALADLRSGLRARLRASPLMDAPRFGRSLADALRRAWHDRCRRA